MNPNLEQLLFRGFIAEPKMVMGFRIVFKTLNPFEVDQARLRACSEADTAVLLLAYSVYLFDGVNVLQGDRDESIKTLCEVFRGLPSTTAEDLLRFEGAEYLKRSAQKDLLKYVESEESQMMFTQYRTSGYRLCDTELTGIVGTPNLGLNPLQSAWLLYMGRDADLQQDEKILEWVKLMGTFVNPALAKLFSEDKSEEEVRSGGYAIPEDFQLKKPLESDDDLVEELERSVKGEMDPHDKLIAEAERGWLGEVRDKLKARIDARAEEDSEGMGPGVFGASRVIPLNKDTDNA